MEAFGQFRGPVALVILTIAGTSVLAAANFWDSKKPAEWSESERRQILTDSPWAKLAQVRYSPESTQRLRSVSGNPAAGSIAGPTTGNGRPPGIGGSTGEYSSGVEIGNDKKIKTKSTGGGVAGLSTPPVLVRWESATPIRSMESGTDSSLSIGDWSDSFYVIALYGLPLATADSEAARKYAVERLIVESKLKVKGKGTFTPDRVETIGSDEGAVFLLLFARKHAFENGGKEAELQTLADPLEIKAKFVFNQMMLRGKPSL